MILGNTVLLYDTENHYIFYAPQIASCVFRRKICCNSSANTIDTENTKTRSLNRAKYTFTIFCIDVSKKKRVFNNFLSFSIGGNHGSDNVIKKHEK